MLGSEQVGAVDLPIIPPSSLHHPLRLGLLPAPERLPIQSLASNFLLRAATTTNTKTFLHPGCPWLSYRPSLFLLGPLSLANRGDRAPTLGLFHPQPHLPTAASGAVVSWRAAAGLVARSHPGAVKRDRVACERGRRSSSLAFASLPELYRRTACTPQELKAAIASMPSGPSTTPHPHALCCKTTSAAARSSSYPAPIAQKRRAERTESAERF